MRAIPFPFQELREAVHLIVMLAVWKGEQFIEEYRQPRRFHRQQNMAGLNEMRLPFHA